MQQEIQDAIQLLQSALAAPPEQAIGTVNQAIQTLMGALSNPIAPDVDKGG